MDSQCSQFFRCSQPTDGFGSFLMFSGGTSAANSGGKRGTLVTLWGHFGGPMQGARITALFDRIILLFDGIILLFDRIILWPGGEQVEAQRPLGDHCGAMEAFCWLLGCLWGPCWLALSVLGVPFGFALGPWRGPRGSWGDYLGAKGPLERVPWSRARFGYVFWYLWG